MGFFRLVIGWPQRHVHHLSVDHGLFSYSKSELQQKPKVARPGRPWVPLSIVQQSRCWWWHSLVMSINSCNKISKMMSFWQYLWEAGNASSSSAFRWSSQLFALWKQQPKTVKLSWNTTSLFSFSAASLVTKIRNNIFHRSVRKTGENLISWWWCRSTLLLCCYRAQYASSIYTPILN